MNEGVTIDEYLKTLLQRDVRFTVNDKVLREGKLIVFNIKDFHCCLMLNRTLLKIFISHS